MHPAGCGLRRWLCHWHRQMPDPSLEQLREHRTAHRLMRTQCRLTQEQFRLPPMSTCRMPLSAGQQMPAPCGELTGHASRAACSYRGAIRSLSETWARQGCRPTARIPVRASWRCIEQRRRRCLCRSGGQRMLRCTALPFRHRLSAYSESQCSAAGQQSSTRQSQGRARRCAGQRPCKPHRQPFASWPMLCAAH